MNKEQEMTVDMIYETIGREIGITVTEKNAQYGDSFGRAHVVLEALYPNGVEPKDYTNLLAITRIIDKLFRIATDHPSDKEDPWRDIGGYAILSLAKIKEKNE